MSIPDTITVRLLKPGKDQTITYQASLVERGPTHRVVRAIWTAAMGRVDLGCVVFEPGDVLYEHFYSDRWYNVFALYSPSDEARPGTFKGWYCNLTRPAVFGPQHIESEDLDIDLFVAPDQRTMWVLDEDEYAAHDFATHEPETHRAVQAALEALRRRAYNGEAPFVPIPGVAATEGQ